MTIVYIVQNGIITPHTHTHTHTHRSMMGLIGLGSTSDYLVHHLHCPVLVVRNIPASGDRILEALSTATEAAATAAAAATELTPATTSATTASDATSDETGPLIQHLSDTTLVGSHQQHATTSACTPKGTTPAPDGAAPSASPGALHQD
jgi:hypothetical protein